VTAGQDVVDAVEQGDSIESVAINGDTVALLEAQKEYVEEWNEVLDG
jgi:peptidyl-prolyl cis-trans isomerase B (cyclophilin B)